MYKETEFPGQECMDCGEKITGRVDKRFCNDSCRTHFNNKKKQTNSVAKPEFLKRIPKILSNNYEILKKLNVESPMKIKRAQLESLGFNFHYMTSCYTTKKGDTYHFCFDQGYLEIKDDHVLLVVQPSQVL